MQNNQIKYKVNQRVFYGSLKCIIIATKTEPYKPTVDPYYRKERFPEKDYLLFRLINVETDEYLGIFDVNESEIEDVEW
ncbi:hypothetical protein [Flavobacterium taihuense]|uniref:Uncharacterized protein n=1 Tax=Flavobacterium taihuense TaxID=2857508 RepID=A0ABS6Y2I8_9FLAO|nr:hypothetical protein [Flavobacterium taihuense]MBW4362746.1 hypothetical protein [Flavobacterium taihuense]